MELIVQWFVNSAFYFRVFLSVLIVASGFAAYLIFRRYVHYGGTDPAERAYSKLVGISITILLFLFLARFWRGRLLVMDRAEEWFFRNEVYGNILSSLIILVIVYLISRAIEPSLLRSAGDMAARHKVRRGVYWGRTIAIILIVLLIWAKSTRNLGMFLGIIGAGFALSLQETILCMAGWVLIIIKRPFDIGDRIQIGDYVGDVIDIRVFQSSLMEVGNWVDADQSTGRMVNIPNSMVFRAVSFNYTKGFPFIWNEIVTVVTFESDWRLAKEIILKHAQKEAGKIEKQVARQISRMQGDYAVRYNKLTPFVYTSIADHGVALTLRYLAPVRRRRQTEHEIFENILDDFATMDNIDFAYPTTRFYNNVNEGKPGKL